MRDALLAKVERFPDLLRNRVGPAYFDAGGLCFAPLLETTPAGGCVMAVYFQSRWSGRALAHIRVRPPRRWLGLARHDLPEVELQIDCPGGAFGVARAPFPIPARYQGRQLAFDTAANVGFPEGRGELLRYRTGLPIGRRTLMLPEGVAMRGEISSPISNEIIWRRELLESTSLRLVA